MDWILVLRWLHVIGATLILGTGAGIAFFMLMAHRTGNAALIAHTANVVVLADYLFTLTAAIAQPITGGLLAYLIGWSLTEPWLIASLALYVFAGLFWIPVILMQRRMRSLASAAAAEGAPLPPEYYNLYRLWFAFGFPAFFAVLAIIWLMLAKPG